MKHIFLPALLGLALSFRCQAQSAEPHTFTFPQATVVTRVRAVFDSASVFVDGRLLDQETKKPLTNAVVTLVSGEARKREKTTRTNETGFFRLGWVGTATERQLTISAPGHETLKTDKLPLGSGVHTQLLVQLAAKRK